MKIKKSKISKDVREDSRPDVDRFALRTSAVERRSRWYYKLD
jgi:hypothetical protein